MLSSQPLEQEVVFHHDLRAERYPLLMDARGPLTHPKQFRAHPVSLRACRDMNERVSGRIERRILKSQQQLVERVVSDDISLDEFCRTAERIQDVSIAHARRRPGGVSQSEFKVLTQGLRSAGDEVAASPSPSPCEESCGDLKSLYVSLKQNDVDAQSAVDELYWKSLQSYGSVVSKRPGIVFLDERAKLRAYLYDDQSEPSTGTSESFVHPQIDEFTEAVMGVFPQLDENSDGVVDRKEARRILTNYKEFNLTPATATTFYSRQQEIASLGEASKANDEAVTLEGLERLLQENHPADPDPDFERVVTRLSKRLEFETQRDSPDASPFKLHQDFRPLEVHQGREGSCWLLSNLPAVDSETLSEVVKPEGEHFRVTLADHRTTIVEPLNEVERRIYSSGDGAWSGLLEKGISQILEEEGRDMNGGLASEARLLLTGRQTQKGDLLKRSLEGPELRDRKVLLQVLEGALQSGGAVLASAVPTDYQPGISKISAAGHGYTVLSVDSKNREIVVRNAWGRGEKADLDGVDDGQFKLSVDDFLANFSILDIDTR